MIDFENTAAGELQSKMHENAQQVKEEDIDTAADKTLKKLLDEGTTVKSDSEKAEITQKVNEMKAKMKAELQALQGKTNESKDKLNSEVKTAYADILNSLKPLDKKYQTLNLACKKAEEMSKKVEDYEGIDSAFNPTRDKFQGILAAYNINHEDQAAEIFSAAQKAYENSNTGTFNFDKTLKYHDLKEVLGLEKYESKLAAYKLPDEALGILMGYMRIADSWGRKTAGDLKSEQNAGAKKESEAYVNYILTTLSDWQRDGKLNIESWLEMSKREEMRAKLASIQTPDSWKEANNKEKDDAAKTKFQTLKDRVEKLKQNLSYGPTDSKIVALLAKETQNIKASDTDEISAVEKLVANESSNTVKGTVESKKTQIRDLSERLNAIQVTGGIVTAETLANWKTELGHASEKIDAISLDKSEDLTVVEKKADDLKAAYSIIKSVSDSCDAADKKVPTTPTGTSGDGGKSPETPATPNKNSGGLEISTLSNPYKEKWGTAELTDSVFGTVSEVKVSDNAVGGGATTFDDLGNMLTLKIPAGTELIRPNVLERSKKIESTVFTKIYFENHYLWVDESQLIRSESASGLSSVDNSDGDKTDSKDTPTVRPDVPPPFGGPELAFLGSVYGVYAPALSRIALNQNSPTGVDFTMKVNNFDMSFHAGYEGGMYKLTYPGGVYEYHNANELMFEINSGEFHRKLAVNTLLYKENYKPYESFAGECDSARFTKNGENGDIFLELDWNGRDPDIFINVGPHGRLSYRVNKSNIGLHGEDTRVGYADSYVDFMNQMAHLRKWAEGDDHSKSTSELINKEMMYSQLTDPNFWRGPEIDKRCGRVLYMTTNYDGKVTVFFDMGGGNDPAHPLNTIIETYVTERETFQYSIRGHNKGQQFGEAFNFGELINKVEQYRN